MRTSKAKATQRAERRARAPRVAFAFLLLAAMCSVALAVDVPTRHPVYDYLLRMEARGLLKHPLSKSLPYSREDVVGLLDEIASHSELSTLEWEQLKSYRSQFAEEIAPSDDTQTVALRFYRNGYDLATLRGNDWVIAGSPVVEGHEEIHAMRLDSTRKMSVWASGFDIRGSVRRFGFSVRATDAHVRGDTKLADYVTFPYRYDVRPSGFDYDEAEASVTYQIPHANLFFGKGRNRWGSGRFDNLVLSDQPTSYTQFRGKFTLGPVELTAVQAKLEQSPPVVVRADTTAQGVPRLEYAEKYLATHRVQFDIARSLDVGLYEAVVYGQRGFDLDYLNPMMFLRSAEHYSDDRDNALMGCDAMWRPLCSVVLHGELLIDDISTTRLGTGFYGNKLGYQGGGEWYDPLGWRNTRLRCEYTRIEPYVYSHKYAINAYQQYGSVLGASTGPNSDVLSVSLAWTVSRPVEIEIWSQHRRHGANPASGRNVGGDAARPWGPGDSQYVHFLDGDLETSQVGGVKGRLEFGYGVYLIASAAYSDIRTCLEAGGRKHESQAVGSLELEWNPW